MRGILRAGAGAALTIAALGAGACGAGPTDDAIYLGVAGPISQASGRSMRLAAEMAADEINQTGGISGRRLELIFKDDEARPEQAIAVATELRDDPRVLAVVGHVNSAATIAAADIYNDDEFGVVELSPASSSPQVREAGPWTFRICPSDEQHGPALAHWIVERLGRRRAAVFYANDDYGRGVLDSFGSAFQAAGGELVARDPFLPALMESDSMIEPFLERAIREGMDALVIAGQAAEGLRVLNVARRLGYSGPVLGADGLTNLREEGEIAEGVYITSAFLPDRPTEAARRFVEDYVARYDELPDHRGAMTYDAIHLLARAMRETGVAQSRALKGAPSRQAIRTLRLAIRNYLAEVGTTHPPFEGVSGTVVFDENGDVEGKEVAIGVVRNGTIVTAGT